MSTDREAQNVHNHDQSAKAYEDAGAEHAAYFNALRAKGVPAEIAGEITNTYVREVLKIAGITAASQVNPLAGLFGSPGKKADDEG